MAESVFIQKPAADQQFLLSLVTGIVEGGEITGIGNPTYDVAPGVAQHVNFTDPKNPVVTTVEFDAKNNVVPLFTATQVTQNAINQAGDLVQTDVGSDPASRRNTAVIQEVTHLGNTVVTSISDNQFPAWNVQQSLLDYVRLLGIINTGNDYEAASNNLTIKKLVGTSSLPFLNFVADKDATNDQPNPEIDPAPFLQLFQNGSGGFTQSFETNVPVGFWDDGSGTLAATNQFVIYRINFFNNGTALTVGQDTYNSLGAALDAVFTEDPNLIPALTFVPNTFRTALIVKGNVTDLSDPTNTTFFKITTGTAGSSSVISNVFDVGYITGLHIENSSGTPDEIVDIDIGAARDAVDSFDIKSGSILSPDITASGANGLDTGAVAANTSYAVYVIADNTASNVPAGLFSLDGVAPTVIPTGWDTYRRVGWIRTDATSDIETFQQPKATGRDRWVFGKREAIIQTAGTSAAFANTATASAAVFVPNTATRQQIAIRATKLGGSATTARVEVVPGGWDETAGATFWECFCALNNVDDITVSNTVEIPVDETNQLVRYRVQAAGEASADIFVRGYEDAL